MVELPEFPAVGVVAGAAIITEPLFVFIIGLMTTETITVGFLVDRGLMAFFTGHGCVHADEGKAAHVVVKHYAFSPAAFAVTLLTLFSEFAVMYIIQQVTHMTFCFVFFFA